MIKVSVLYPNQQQCHFDFDYYCKFHMPLVKERLGKACQGMAVDRVVAGDPGAPAPYVAVGHLYFESMQAFQESFGPHAEEILADLPKFTNVQPVVMISDVLLNATRSQTGELHIHQP